MLRGERKANIDQEIYIKWHLERRLQKIKILETMTNLFLSKGIDTEKELYIKKIYIIY